MTTSDFSAAATRRKGGPVQRHARVRASYTRKVELLEMWAAHGVPKGQWVPKGPTDLARWDDVDLGVTAWTDPSVTSPDRHLYSDLRARFDAALARLKSAQAALPSVKPLPVQCVAQLEKENEALSGQVCELRIRMSKVERDHRLETQRRKSAEEDVAALKRQLAKLAPLRGRKLPETS